MMNTNVQILESDCWYKGWALDFQTISSTPLSDGRFETERPELGEALYSLKYKSDKRQIDPIANTVSNFLLSNDNQWWFRYLSAIIPVPPSYKNRPFQPVLELAKSISIKSGILCHDDYLVKVKETEQLKNLDHIETRYHQLEGAFSVKDNRFFNRTILVFDDLYRSGETLKAICKTIKKEGNARYIYVLTVTKTRVIK